MNSPAKTSSGATCKKCLQKGSRCAQHSKSSSPKSSRSPKSKKASPKRASPSSAKAGKTFIDQISWERSKFDRELTEKLEKLAIKSPKKASPRGSTLRSPSTTRKSQPTDQYEGDILEFLKKKEKAYPISDKFPSHQTDITENMRSILVDWLAEVTEEYHLGFETFHLSVSICDRYIALKRVIPKSKLQLYGLASLLIAAKYEEIFPPSVNDLAYISDNTFKAQEIIAAEAEVLFALKYEITYPTCASFATAYFDILNLTNDQKAMAKYVMDSSVMYMSSYKYLPSLVAAGAIFYAIRAMPEKTNGAWSAKMRKVTGYEEHEVLKVAMKALDWLKPGSLKAIKLVYARAKNFKVSDRDLVTTSVLNQTFASPKKASPKKIPSPKKVSPKKSSVPVVAKAPSPKKASPKKSPPKAFIAPTIPSGAHITYSDRYAADDGYEYRHVILPPSIFKLAPRGRLLTEAEWRGLGVQQSKGWVHYSLHRPEPHILLFRRPLDGTQ